MGDKIRFSENLSKRQIVVGLIMMFTQCTKLFGIVPEMWILLCEFICVGIFFKYTLFESFNGLKSNIKRTIIWSICGFIIIFVIQNILWNSIFKQVVMKILGIESVINSNQSKLETMFTIYPLFMIVLVIVLGPILEELVYRFILFRIIYEKNKFLGYLVSAFIFGLQHVILAVVVNGQAYEWINIINYMIMGYGLSFVYVKTKNLSSSIIIHMISNCLGVLIMI